MRDTDILVIGGGVAGTSLLYHLSRLSDDARDLLLVEKDELTSGSTWHAAGLCTQFNSSPALMKLLRSSLALYASLEAETGQAVDFHRCGSLRLACTEERLDEYRHRQGMAQTLDIPFELIEADAVRGHFPLLDTTGVLGAAYLPTDGYVDPTGVTQALAKGARARGAEIWRRCGVRGIERVGERWVVDTPRGEIRARQVVNAAGQWAPEIARMVGVELPIVPLEHHYLITEPLAEVAALERELPVLRDVDASFYVRAEGGGLLVGPFERYTRVWGREGIPEDFHGRLLEPDLERLEPVLADVAKRIPRFADAGIRTALNGPDGYTPDGRCLMGPMPDCPDFHVLAGFSIFGIVFSGGAGRYAAEWITRGRPSDDLSELDVRRFDRAESDGDYVAARACEVYGHEYAIHYPDEEGQAGRPLKTGPLYALHKSAGAVFGTARGWERPLWFQQEGDPPPRPSFRRGPEHDRVAAECRSLRQGAGLLDDTGAAILEIAGPGVSEWLDGISASRVPARDGETRPALFCNEDGAIEAEGRLTRVAPDRMMLVGDGEREESLVDWLGSRLGRSGLYLDRRSTRDTALRLAGPTAPAILANALGSDAVPEPGAACELYRRGVQVRIARVDELDVPEFALEVPSLEARSIWHRLWGTGLDRGIARCGHRAYDALRLEAGALHGPAISTHWNPLVVGWESRVDWDKGAFPGREALIALRHETNPPRLCRLGIETGDADPVGGEPVWGEGPRPVGRVSFGGYAYGAGRSIAYAVLPAEPIAAGTRLEVQILGTRRAAEVIAPRI